VVDGAVVLGYEVGVGATEDVVTTGSGEVDGAPVGRTGLVDAVGSGAASWDDDGADVTSGSGVTSTGTAVDVTDAGGCEDVVDTGREVDEGAGASSPPPEASANVGTAMPRPPSTTAPATTTSRLRTCCS
jgi:hypothetical protein